MACEYCAVDPDKVLYWEDSYADDVYVNVVVPDGEVEYDLEIYATVNGEDVETHFRIYYCPMCGRKLEVE